MRHTEDCLIAADGTQLYTQVWAADQPRAHIIVVHGLGEHSGRYQNYVDYFVPRGYTLHGADSRGHGRSGGKRGHADRFELFVADLDQRVAQVRSTDPARPIFIFGHSLGSLMVLKYGLNHPAGLSGIIVTGTALRDALAMPKWKRSLASLLGNIAPSMRLDNGVLVKRLSHDPAVLAAYESDPLVHRWATPRLATEVEAVRTELYRRAGDWHVPMLMLHGGADLICLPAGAQAFQAKTPPGLAEYREYAGLFHEIHNEPERAEVFKVIAEWLDSRQQ